MKNYKKPKLDHYKNWYVGDKLIHKACNLKLEILGFEYDIFGVYVITKVIDHFKWRYHYFGKINTYTISILREYKKITIFRED